MNNQLLQKWLRAGNVSISTILLTYYRQIGLSNEELILIIQLKSLMDQGNLFPDTAEIAQRMGNTTDSIFQGIHELIQKKVLTIETETSFDGKSQDFYNLALLWDKLALCIQQVEQQQTKAELATVEKDLYQQFEAEFARPLSPIEIETIGMWLDEDHYSVELIELALREAVLSQVYSLKYVDRILLSWERKNIKTKEQVLKESEKFRQNSMPAKSEPKQQNNESTTQVPLHNWLNNE
ncbi:DnaD domain protein [Carnobacterium gallinarum]|uniref:DnaD domain protein n=1 Tax=Carnobacterium gallinarum TaxID=2749 RepID=UPI00054DAF66|nr:DnaD domain protein [Carnobacterium gallinarum]